MFQYVQSTISWQVLVQLNLLCGLHIAYSMSPSLTQHGRNSNLLCGLHIAYRMSPSLTQQGRDSNLLCGLHIAYRI